MPLLWRHIDARMIGAITSAADQTREITRPGKSLLHYPSSALCSSNNRFQKSARQGISLLGSANPPSLRSADTTFTVGQSASSRSAVARPIPLPPPVMITVECSAMMGIRYSTQRVASTSTHNSGSIKRLASTKEQAGSMLAKNSP